MRRREFIILLGGASVAWPLATYAQQGERMRRIAVLMGSAQTELDQVDVSAFLQRLNELGWKEGHNVRVNVRWWTDGPQRMRGFIADMLASSPDVVMVFTNQALAVLKPMAGNVSIVFVGVGDPVGSGFVTSLARPGDNITGFTSHEGPMGGKWLEILMETAPRLSRIMAILHPETPVHLAFWDSLKAAAPRFAVEVTAGGVHDAPEIERAISAFAGPQNSGLIVFPHAVALANRELIVASTLRHGLPAIFGGAGSAAAGALAAYGVDFEDSFRRTAEYVDRVLRGEKPADLPVQQPIKFKLSFNLKAAKILGLQVPDKLLALADEVIE
jgi:putative ABC transport system substrate-binding protein